MSNLDPIPYSDARLRAILQRVKTIAMVGASSNWNRPSYFVMKYLQGKGYRVIPVNPGIAGESCSARRSTPRLRDIPEHQVDMVDVFRASREAAADRRGRDRDRRQGGVDAARHPQRRRGRRAEKAGIEVIMNRCPKIEFGRLRGELSWSGVNSGIIRNRAARAAAGTPRQAAAQRLAQPDLRLRDPRHPCRRGARPGDRRPLDADLPDHLLRLRRCRPRRLALQPAQFRLHLFAADQPDGRGPGRAGGEPRRRPRAPSPRPRATPRSS